MRRNGFYLFVAFILFHLLTLLGRLALKPAGLERVEELDDGWYVSYNETEYKDVKLSQLRKLIGRGAKRGDRIIMVREDVDLSTFMDPTLLLETRFSAVTVSFGGKEIEHKYIYDYKYGRYVGCEDNFIALPEDITKGELKIDLLVTENGAYNYYEAPVVGSYSDLFMYEVYNNLLVFMISAFLVIFGFVFFVIALGFKSNLPEIKMLMYSSLLFIALGVWFLTQFNLLYLFFDIDVKQTVVEYISLYSLVPIMYMVMGSMQDYLKKKIFLFFSITGTVVAIVPVILHFLDVIHINQTLVIYQLDALVLFIFMSAMLCKDWKNKRITPSQRIQLTGQIMLTLSFVVNVIFYYLEVNGISKQILFSKEIVSVGALCMVFATLVNYSIYIAASYARKKEYRSLAHYAYADGLTNIPNRARLEKHFSDLAKKDADYCLISIDLNGLKAVNDSQGHLMGDKYLKEFAGALDEVMEGKGFVARIGGDEFVAVLEDESIGLADSVIKEIEAALEKLNQEDPEIHRSAACGYAYKHEAESDNWNDVYLFADERMYVEKAKMKEALR